MPAYRQTLANKLDRLSSGWTIALAVLAYAIYLTSIMPAQSVESRAYAGDWGGPDRHFFYTPDELYAAVSTWGAAGRQQYINFRLGLDVGFALTYAAFLVTVTSVAIRRAWPGDVRRRQLNLLALLPMGFDLLENVLGIGLVAAYPARLENLAWMTAGVTALKWFSLALAHVVLVYTLTGAAAGMLRQRRCSK